MTHVFHRIPKIEMPHAAGGEGVYIIDSAGKRYLDASGGAAVSCLGHNHPAITAAIKAQLGAISFAHTSFFTTDAMERLAALLSDAAPGDLSYAYFVSGGSEAVEAALKMARQYFVEIGQPQRRHIISRRQSYHGNTIGALSAGGNFQRRAPFEPLLISSVRHIAPCYAYRDQTSEESEEAYGLRIADELEAKIGALGSDTVAAFILEPVVGATLGAVPPVPGYLKRIREICDRHGVLLIFDEVMCGMGRTGTLFACEQEGVAPDLLTVAKGLAGGYQPIGALMVSEKIYRAIRDGSGYFEHGHTYMGHPLACAAALAVQKTIREDDLLARVVAMGTVLEGALIERFGNHQNVGDIRGRGLFQAIELVADRASKTPFDAGARLHARIKSQAMARGLICYPMGGTIDGKSGDHVLLAPPFIISEDEITLIVERLAEAVDAAIASVEAD